MYLELSPELKREISPVVTSVLEKVLEYGGGVLESGLKEKLRRLLAEAGKAG